MKTPIIIITSIILSLYMIGCSSRPDGYRLQINLQHTWFLPDSLVDDKFDEPYTGYIVNTKKQFLELTASHRKIISYYHFMHFDEIDFSQHSIIMVASHQPFFGISAVKNNFSDTIFAYIEPSNQHVNFPHTTYAIACVSPKVYEKSKIKVIMK